MAMYRADAQIKITAVKTIGSARAPARFLRLRHGARLFTQIRGGGRIPAAQLRLSLTTLKGRDEKHAIADYDAAACLSHQLLLHRFFSAPFAAVFVFFR